MELGLLYNLNPLILLREIKIQEGAGISFDFDPSRPIEQHQDQQQQQRQRLFCKKHVTEIFDDFCSVTYVKLTDP